MSAKRTEKLQGIFQCFCGRDLKSWSAGLWDNSDLHSGLCGENIYQCLLWVNSRYNRGYPLKLSVSVCRLQPTGILPKMPCVYQKTLRALNRKLNGMDEFVPETINFSNYINRATESVTWEAIPSKASEILPEIYTADPSIKREYTHAMRMIIQDESGKDLLLEMLGGSLYSKQESSRMLDRWRTQDHWQKPCCPDRKTGTLLPALH